ncbi:hypothetical protein TSOC_001310 [Tetrabaena socialis]|uniref:Uncharacterized protein n=1 Tax=Tetrabaena socialis TaxID=47790 RepID=A0A2J8AH25_9CHLO|nr:hypothetical protein TSOC_001310 [Tetrabaena socialis]|eukprot:PNH11824.1 hypothetical protein TSOC_001310 [Tetrabaena socialis]
MLASMQMQRLARVHQARQTSCRLSRGPATTCAAARGSDAPSTSSPALLSVAAAAVAAAILSTSGPSFAAPLYDTLPGFGGEKSAFFEAVEQERQQRQPDLDDLFDENLMTEDMRRFVDSVTGNKLKPEQYQSGALAALHASRALKLLGEAGVKQD